MATDDHLRWQHYWTGIRIECPVAALLQHRNSWACIRRPETLSIHTRQVMIDLRILVEQLPSWPYKFNIIGLTESASKKVSKNAAGIIWLLKKKLAPAGAGMSSPLPSDTTEFFKSTVEKFIIPANLTQHIMISYNRASRDLCLQIKAELEKLKFKVWIDVEDISGSSLESMANAIENSFCILVCMTEKYKQSPNCRWVFVCVCGLIFNFRWIFCWQLFVFSAEGEYSFQLNKPIIPLFMQKDWFPDGWLGNCFFFQKK